MRSSKIVCLFLGVAVLVSICLSGAAYAQVPIPGGNPTTRVISPEEIDTCQAQAALGNAKALCQLADLYLHGEYLPQDLARARQLMEKSAAQGYLPCIYSLGILYMQGIGVKKDAKKAIEFFKRAADGGNTEALYNLGVIYSDGVGVPKDERKAVAYYKEAVKEGHVFAHCNLGVMYLQGRGVARDEEEPKRLFKLAANAGDEMAAEALRTIEGKGAANASCSDRLATPAEVMGVWRSAPLPPWMQKKYNARYRMPDDEMMYFAEDGSLHIMQSTGGEGEREEMTAQEFIRMMTTMDSPIRWRVDKDGVFLLKWTDRQNYEERWVIRMLTAGSVQEGVVLPEGNIVIIRFDDDGEPMYARHMTRVY